MGNRRFWHIALFLLLLTFISLLLFTKPFIGIANNGDFSRVITPLGFVLDHYPGFFHAFREFQLVIIDNEQPFLTAIGNILSPELEGVQEYSTTQNLFIKMAMIANYIFNYIFNRDTSIFDIYFLGFTYVVFYVIGLYLFTSKLTFKKPHQTFIHILLTLFIFCDIAYLVYFNSFFGEATILVSLFLIVGFVAWIIQDQEERKLPLVFFFISCLLFIGAKVANTPVGVLLALFSLLFLFVRKGLLSRILIMIGSVTILIFSVLSFVNAPTWMKQVNNYNTIFYGVLKDSPTPEQDLKDLGIDEKYVVLQNSPGFSGVVDVYGEKISKDVYENASYLDVLTFYLTHPKRFIEKLELSAESSVYIRPSYLSNYDKQDTMDSLSFTERFSLWENLRKQAVGNAFKLIVLYSLLYFMVICYLFVQFFRMKVKNYRHLIQITASLLVLFTAAGQFIIPVVGNGEADLQKHMFLFNICFDLMILIGVMWLLDKLVDKKFHNRYTYGGVIGVILLILMLNIPFQSKEDDSIKIGDTVVMGSYENEAMEWIVLDKDNEKGYLLWLKDAIDNRAFDKRDEALDPNAENLGSNYWETSDIQEWLNGEFLDAFSDNEKEMIQTTKLRNILPHHLIEQKVGGERPFYWTSILSYLDQNYEQAYYNFSYNQVFLLDVQQVKKFVYDQGISTVKRDVETNKKVDYWLRTPYYLNTTMTRAVGTDGFVYHKFSILDNVSVVPAIYVNDKYFINQ